MHTSVSIYASTYAHGRNNDQDASQFRGAPTNPFPARFDDFYIVHDVNTYITTTIVGLVSGGITYY